ncbi:hypothetical protein [Halostreptopolyspora alba]|uniref:Uncharacterized protein n=1 Tax=Halostreptopolyspora alba TaxID=2487137 RepID=A0A3N0E6Y6_9ACTN|nr:hypothetical protein EFW17_15235 [Nocardiopsaceae bacterium YIM 96095]
MASDDPIQYGKVKASYFWDDGSGINGDTGAPASGEPMQKGLFASPSWPLGTEGYVEYNGERAEFFIGDRGPGDPAENCDVLLDLDGQTFAELTGQTWDDQNYTVSGGNGHIEVEYYITEWGDGDGNEGAPHAMGDEGNRCEGAVSELPEQQAQQADGQAQEEQDEGQDQAAAERQQQAEQLKEKKQELQERQDAAVQREQELQDRQQDEEPEPELAEEAGAEGETQAHTAASDMSGIELASSDTPLAAGVLTLAILPALIVALLFAEWNRPTPTRADDGAEPPVNGRHRKAGESPLSRLRRWLPRGRR